jgi:hypothetical protein
MPERRGDRPTTADVPILLPRGAFLIECGEPVTGGQLTGRVEHIVSGRAASFESAGTLIAFIRRVLALGHDNGAGDVSPACHQLNGSGDRTRSGE